MYKELKEKLRQEAMEWQAIFSEQRLSYEELTEMVCNYDKENAVPGLCKEEEAFLGPGADDREADDFEGPEDRNLKTDRAGWREVSSDRLED